MLKARNEALRQYANFEFYFALLNKTEQLIGSLNAGVRMIFSIFRVQLTRLSYQQISE